MFSHNRKINQQKKTGKRGKLFGAAGPFQAVPAREAFFAFPKETEKKIDGFFTKKEDESRAGALAIAEPSVEMLKDE